MVKSIPHCGKSYIYTLFLQHVHTKKGAGTAFFAR